MSESLLTELGRPLLGIELAKSDCELGIVLVKGWLPCWHQSDRILRDDN
jgi:hypothetical protein